MGAAISVVGLVLLLPSPLTVTMLGLSTIAWQIQVRLVEEPHMIAVHGEDYRHNAATTGRFLPYLGRLLENR